MKPSPEHQNPINVLVVDDSAVMRSLIKRILGDDADVNVVASAVDGAGALGQLNLYDVDVVLLDIQMQARNSMSAIPDLLRARPHLKIIMITSSSDEQINQCVHALELGAVDYVTKPNGKTFSTPSSAFQDELISKIKNWGDGKRKKRGAGSTAVKRPNPAKLLKLPVPKQIILRSGAIPRPSAIAIGSSTGGPEALSKIIPHLKDVTQPVFITQHMPPSFLTIMAGHINDYGALPCVEAKDGMRVQDKTIYLAPGDFHMTVEADGDGAVIRLNQNPPENFCRPAVDPMLRSLSAYYGNKLFITILTGMGVDGRQGAKLAVEAGASMIAQDEASSVVWGMPAAVAQSGLCHAVLPLNDIGPAIARIARKGQPE
ncbi:MAG: chemotaxis-specific protein-glutamate methyltransferase CheB [Alphaproteobacteria bacterium]|nr:chemotaxis-specific protein-glutamate methyltransferase CheB [Alphaproteobacteria bacterium]